MFLSLFQKLNKFFEKHAKIGNVLVFLFDHFSKFTHFFLFHWIGFFSLIVLLFSVPVAYSFEFIEFLIQIKQSSQCIPHFLKLPPALKFIFLFYIFFVEIVGFCTLLAYLPYIQQKMIAKHQNPKILKERGYNSPLNSLRRATASGLPIAAAILVAGDVTQHQISVETLRENKKQILEVSKETQNLKVLEKFQNIPTNSSFSEKIHRVAVKFKDLVIELGSGSRSRD